VVPHLYSLVRIQDKDCILTLERVSKSHVERTDSSGESSRGMKHCKANLVRGGNETLQ